MYRPIMVGDSAICMPKENIHKKLYGKIFSIGNPLTGTYTEIILEDSTKISAKNYFYRTIGEK